MSSALEMLAGRGFGAEYGFNFVPQMSLFKHMTCWLYNGGGSATTGPTAHGWTNISVGLISVLSVGTAVDTQCIITNFSTATSINAVGGTYAYTADQNMMWRGNGAGLGGFLFATRFSQTSEKASTRAFIGITSLTGATTMVTANPSAAAADFIGIGFNATDSGNWRAMWKDGTTYGDADLGSNAARASGNNLYDLYIYALPNDSKIYMSMYNVYSSTTVLSETAYSTNIPRNTIFMGPMFLCCAASAGAAPGLGYSRTAIYTPY